MRTKRERHPRQHGGAGLADYDEAVAAYDTVLGLEVHVELGTATKMFCGCDTTFGAPPNTQVCPTCLGLPGSLPVLNAAAVESTVRVGLALGCDIATWCRFARKNYFYPDMPKNFQTSQYDEPICTDGHLEVDVETDDGPRTFRIEIERVHMEEDTGKSLHVGGATGRIHGADHSLVDYNRAGIPLIEIVTKPVEGTGALAPQVARAYVTALRELMRTLGVSDVRMEQGSLRCDVNLSLRPSPSDPLGTRSETKNVNSLRSVERAMQYEIRRQAALLSAGGRVVQETRHWHEDTGTTTSGRSKEQAEDYRYFPEPDLVPVAPDAGVGRGAAGRAAGRPGGAPPRAAGRVGLLRPRHDRPWSTPAPSTSSRARSRPVRRPRPPASGGWASWPGRPTSARSTSPSSRSLRRRSRGWWRWSSRVR